MEQYIHNHIKHFYRKCPRIINIADEMFVKHKNDDVYETCLKCENARNIGMAAAKP